MKKTSLLLGGLFLLFCFLGFSQETSENYTVTWARLGGEHKSTVFPLGICKSEDGYVSVVKETIHGPGGFKYFIEVFDNNMKSLSVNDVSEQIDEKLYRTEDVFQFGTHFVMVTSRTFAKEKREETYIQLIDSKTGQLSERQLIANLTYKLKVLKLNLDFVSSPDNKLLLARIIYPFIPNQEQLVGFKLFDENLKLKWEKDNISLLVNNLRYQIDDVVVNNSGEIFLLGRNYTDAKIRAIFFYDVFYKTNDNMAPYEILSFKDGELVSNKVKISEMGLLNFTIQVGKDNKLHGVGYYSIDQYNRQLDGVVSAAIDPNTGELSNMQRKQFDKEMLQSGLSDHAKKVMDRKESAGKNLGVSNDLQIKKVVQHEDGSLSFVGEIYRVIVVTSTNANGTSTTRYYYEYSDLIVSRIATDGSIQSIAKIFKKVTYNKPIGHSIVYDNANKLVALFPDLRVNYFKSDTSAAYRDLPKELRREPNVLTCASVAADGTINRECVIDYAKVPEDCFDARAKGSDENMFILGNEALLFTYYGKKQFGFIRVTPK